MNTKNILTLAFAFGMMAPAALLTASCAAPLGVAAGAGAATGIAAVQEGGLKRAASDAKIQASINDLWFTHNVEMFRKLDLTVNQGRVLVTGVVQNPEHRVEAIRLAWQPPGVKQVINEVKVADSTGIVGFARDSWISTRLRTSITLDKQVQSINYNIDTVQGVVYLMGFAQNQAELDRVIETARTIPDVRQVVSYVKIIGQEDTTGNEPVVSGEQGTLTQPLQPQADSMSSSSEGTSSQLKEFDYNDGGYENNYGTGEDTTNDGAPIRLQPVDKQSL